MGKHPLGRPCPIEWEFFTSERMRYITEYGVDPESHTELHICSQLAEIELLLWRCNQNLAQADTYGGLLIDQSMGVDKNGDPITQKQISPLIELKERLENRRLKLVKIMVGDRQEKYKREAALKVREDVDPSSQMSALRDQMQRLQHNIDALAVNDELSGDSGGTQTITSPEDIIGSEE